MLEKLCYNGEILIQDQEFEGDEMDTKISVNVKRLIELDQKSVALEKEWESQLKELEENFKKELEGISGGLQEAKDEAKKIYSELLEKAQLEVQAMAVKGDCRLQGIERSMSNSLDQLAQELWSQIKETIK